MIKVTAGVLLMEISETTEKNSHADQDQVTQLETKLICSDLDMQRRNLM